MDVKSVGRRIAVALGLAVFASSALAQAAYRIHVDGLACPFCAYGIEKKLGALPGVAGLETHLKDGTVIITMKEGAVLDEASAKRAVQEAGFSLRQFEALPSAPQDAPAAPVK